MSLEGKVVFLSFKAWVPNCHLTFNFFEFISQIVERHPAEYVHNHTEKYAGNSVVKSLFLLNS
jgi:hypothetical protein